jgi:hypothetical protein
VTDPDSVLNSLTREVKEIDSDGREVNFAVFKVLLHNLRVDD